MPDEKRLHPFDIRDQFTLLDRLHEYQRGADDLRKTAEAEFKYFRERIDQGISPTMQKVKQQNEDLEKMIIRLQDRVEFIFQQLTNQIESVRKDSEKGIESANQFVADVKDLTKALVIKAVLGIASAIVIMGAYVYQIRTQISALPASFEVRQHHPAKRQAQNENNPFGTRD